MQGHNGDNHEEVRSERSLLAGMPGQPGERSAGGRRARGEVRESLVAAAVALAREAGPDAVLLREVTRRVGVVPNAAYRHFRGRDELLFAVCVAAMRELATQMEHELAAVDGDLEPQARARARVTAVGIGYLRFARHQPGLFRTAFAVPDHLDYADDLAAAGSGGRNPLQLLGDALDGLVEVGLLPASRRNGAQYAAWAAVHGLAVLQDNGPLRALPDAEVTRAEKSVMAMIARGL